MKKLLTIIYVLFSASAFAQCGTIQCSNPITLPLPTDQNAYNAINNIGGSRCFTNNPQQINTIPNGFNWNQWNYLTFQYGLIQINQNINFGNNGQKVYVLASIVNMTHVSMNGGSNDPDTIFLMQGILNIDDMTANNLHNYIVMSPGTILNIEGVSYYPGMTWQGQGNSTNVVNIIACSGTPLSNDILSFTLDKDVLKWKVTSDQQIEIQYSVDSKEFQFEASTSQKDGGMIIHKSGFYRLKVGETLSRNMERYNPAEIKENKEKIYFYDGSFNKIKPIGRGYGFKILK